MQKQANEFKVQLLPELPEQKYDNRSTQMQTQENTKYNWLGRMHSSPTFAPAALLSALSALQNSKLTWFWNSYQLWIQNSKFTWFHWTSKKLAAFHLYLKIFNWIQNRDMFNFPPNESQCGLHFQFSSHLTTFKIFITFLKTSNSEQCKYCYVTKPVLLCAPSMTFAI